MSGRVERRSGLLGDDGYVVLLSVQTSAIRSLVSTLGLPTLAQTLEIQQGLVSRTPLRRFAGILLKLENRQDTGSFKFRGALTTVSAQGGKGFFTGSTGNFGKAVARAVQTVDPDAKCIVVMPVWTDEAKREVLRSMGAEVLVCGPTRADYEATMSELRAKHPSYRQLTSGDDPFVLAGNGTGSVEALKELDERVGRLFVPIGSGGNIAGAIWARASLPQYAKWQIVGVELQQGARFHLSKAASGPIVRDFSSVCDGASSPKISALSFDLMTRYLDDVVLVSDDEVLDAMARAHEVGLQLEPTACMGAAAASRFDGVRLAIATGGNVTFKHREALRAHVEAKAETPPFIAT